jgi:hypothetical protein
LSHQVAANGLVALFLFRQCQGILASEHEKFLGRVVALGHEFKQEMLYSKATVKTEYAQVDIIITEHDDIEDLKELAINFMLFIPPNSRKAILDHLNNEF